MLFGFGCQGCVFLGNLLYFNINTTICERQCSLLFGRKKLPAGSKARGWGCSAPHVAPGGLLPFNRTRDLLPVTGKEVVCGMVAAMSRLRNVAKA